MRAAVLGSPIAHSKSPLLHAAAYRILDLPWTYERHEVDEAAFPAFLAGHTGEFRGLSLTMPLKRVAFATAQEHDAAALATGAVNTLVFSDRLRGFNTDVVGFREALRAAGTEPGVSATIIGTGATAQSAAFAMVMDGVKEIHIVGRRADAVRSFQQWLETLGVVSIAHAWEAPLPATAVTISAVIAGATDDLRIPTNPGLLFDAVYEPWPTALAAKWHSTGSAVLGGTDLLIHQAAEQVLLMTRVHADNREAIVMAMHDAIRISRTRA